MENPSSEARLSMTLISSRPRARQSLQIAMILASMMSSTRSIPVIYSSEISNVHVAMAGVWLLKI
jgi:hypothetical protein